jgi:hypothetical protein
MLGDDSASRESRDTLIELVSAALIPRSCLVKIGNAEDLSITLHGFSPFAVECKRPACTDTVPRNLVRVSRQLQRRYHSGYDHGMAFIGVDRIASLRSNYPEVDSDRDIRISTHQFFERLRSMIQPEAARAGITARTTPAIGLVFVGTIIAARTTYTVARLRLIQTGPIVDERFLAFERAMGEARDRPIY